MATDPGTDWRSLTPFECLAGDPQAWQEAAHDLVGSANIILDALRYREERDGPTDSGGRAFWRTPLMLYGLAAENLIKAIIVAGKPAFDPSFPLSGGSFPGWFKKHDLLELAKRAGVWLSHSQKHLLGRLRVFVECGRYPVGLREGQDRSTRVFFGGLDWNDVFQLLEYLEEELQRTSGGRVQAHRNLRGIHSVHP